MSDDRDKLSFSERDRLLRERQRGDAPPGGREADEESRRASAEALQQADTLFAGGGRGGSAGRVLGQAIRDAHGSEGFLAACRAYRDQVGVPDDPSLLALFLDTGDRDLVVGALEALLRQKEGGVLEPGAGLRTQLRVLAQDRDDTVAGIAEDLLAD